MKHFYKKLCSGLLVIAMLLTMCGSAFAAAVPFPDISGHWAEKIIDELSADGIIAGYEDGRCHPDNTITRGEFATLVASFFEFTAERGDTSGFTDVADHWAAKSICGLTEKNIILPADYGDTYEPDREITRMEMILMMVRAIGKTSDADKAAGSTSFADDKDIRESDRGYINTAAKYKIVVGFPDGTVRPYHTATRAEGFAMLKRMMSAYEEIQKAEQEKPTNTGGGSYVYPAPTIAFTLPKTAYTGAEITVTATAKNASSVTWTLTKDGELISVEGFSEKGGSLKLEESGVYTLTATATNPRGKTAECQQTITVYPIAGLAFSLPATAHTDTTIPVELLSENIGDASVSWSIERDGQPVSLTEAASGTLDNTGGILQFIEAGEYTVTASVTDVLGKEYSFAQTVRVYPAASIELDLSKATHTDTDVQIVVSGKYLEGLPMVWSVTKDDAEIDPAEALDGELTDSGGTVRFTAPGTYVLTATATDETGRGYTASDSITVYPIANLAFTLPATAHTDTAIPVELLSENIGDASVSWSIERDGQPVSLTEAANGSLDNTGGILQFIETGEYTVTASVTDEIGREFSFAQTVKIYPTASIELKLPKTTHTDTDEQIVVSGEYLEGLSIVWSITKDGADIDPSGVLDGTLTDNGGTVRFTAPGTYALTVTAIDETGRCYTAADRITVYPVGTVGFFMPSIFHTDDEVTVEATITELADNALTWTLTRNGKSVDLDDYLIGTLTERGGSIQIREKGNYVLTASFVDGGGRAYSYQQAFTVYPVPAVNFSLPATAWTDSDLAVTVIATDMEDITIEWLVDNTYGYQDWNTYIDGSLDNDGGMIRFKRAGSYELVARITDATGRVFLYEVNANCEVQPVLDLRFTVLELFAANETVDIRTAGNNNVLPVDWTLEKNGHAVALADYTTGTLNAYGGRIAFPEHGDYMLTVSVTDVLGRSFSHSAAFYVYPVATFSVSVPETVHIGKGLNVEVDGSNLDGCSIEWMLEKDGLGSPIDGLLNMDGGTLVLEEVGSYMLTASLTDAYGNVKTEQSCFEVTNNAPTAPRITTSVDYTDGINTYSADCKVWTTISVTASDPDGDSISLEYDGNSADSAYYGLGTHKARIRAIDEWGAASEWAEQTFTVACVQPSVEVTSDVLGDAVSTTAGELEFDAAVVTTTPYKITAMDYYYPEGAGTTVDIPASAHTIVKGLEYHEGRHFLIVQVMDWFGNTAYTSRFFVMGEDEVAKNSEMTSMSTTVYENGVYDGETPMAYIEGFTLSIPAISGHNTGCGDVITVSGVTEDGITETLLTFNTNNGYVRVSSDGTYEYTPSSDSITTGTWDTWISSRYTKLIFSYVMTSGHESCLARATEGLDYTVQYAFIPLDEDGWEDLFK